MVKNAVICGAGKIGKAYLAEILQNGGYHMTFLVHSDEMTGKLREAGKYTIFRGSRDEKSVEEVVISDFDAFCTVTEEDLCVKALSDTEHVFLPVYPAACPDFGRMIGKAINIRAEKVPEDFYNIYMCVNFMDATKTIVDAILPYLDEKGKKYFEEKTGVSETLVGRMCVDATEEMKKKDPLSVVGGYGDPLKVDKDTYKGELPDCEWIESLDRIPARFTYKIWVTNMKHFGVSMYGDYYGYTYVREACADERIEREVRVLAEKEATLGVAYRYSIPVEEIVEGFKKKSDPWETWKNPNSNDGFARVVFDLRRKLAKNDRVIGPALSCLKSGVKPDALSKIAALAMIYRNDNDPSSVDVHRILEENGVREVLHEFAGLSEDDRDERELMDLIEDQYYILARKSDLK